MRKISLEQPSLPGNGSGLALGSAVGGNRAHGRGRRKTQTTLATPRLSTETELGWATHGLRLRVRRTLPAARGNSAVVLYQRPHKSFLLSWLRSGRGSHSLCRVVSASVLP